MVSRAGTGLAILKMSEPSITLSERAAKRIAEILQTEDAALMRVSVEGGGCSGFQYRFDVVQDAAPDDVVVERDGARVVVDPISLSFVRGGSIVGIPGGADQIRSLHPWGYLNDESSFQPDAGECFNEALSAVRGKILFNSSAGPGWYADARRDIIRNEET